VKGERKTFTFITETVEVEESVCPKTFQRLLVWGQGERERENRNRSNNYTNSFFWGKERGGFAFVSSVIDCGGRSP
jgi:hypothetical protein